MATKERHREVQYPETITVKIEEHMSCENAGHQNANGEGQNWERSKENYQSGILPEVIRERIACKTVGDMFTASRQQAY